MSGTPNNAGKVWIVGAGPGAPDLLTLRAARAIEQAEVLIWTDSLVNPQLAAMAPAGCERIRTSTLTLEEVMALMLDRVAAGRRVVRLHDGDTCLYSALNEQLCRLLDAEVEVEVVPGLSAYQATAAALRAELTIPGLVQTIVLSRAGGRTGVPDRESLRHLAALQASLCLYLSARHVGEVQQELLRHYPADTPVAVVLSRERVDPLNRWRSDPERVMRREFSLTSPFEVTGMARIRVDTRASDDALNQLLGVTGAVANRRLTGDSNSRGIFATDGDPSSAWATPFGTPVGSSLTLTATKEGVGGFTLQQPLDEFHSLIIAASISQGGRSFDVGVGHPDEQGRSEVSLPQPLAKGPFTLTITRVAERTTLDRRYGEPTVLPAAIADLSGDGIGVTEFVGGDHAPTCALGYLTVDGAQVGVEMDEDAYQSLRVGETIERPLCTSDTAQSLSLAAGSHRLETTPPAGLQIDTVVLRSPGSTASATPPTVDVHRTRLTRTATVSGCPNGCWLILGEGDQPRL